MQICQRKYIIMNMKILSQKREGNKVILEIEEEYSGFEKAREKALVQAGKEIKIPGFRPGKAPKELVERNVDSEVLENHAAQNLISELYPQIITEAKLDPVDYPKVEVMQQEKNKPFTFKIEVEVYPEVKLGKYKGIKAEKKTPEVKEEEVSQALGNLQNRFKKDKEELPLDDEFAKTVSGLGTLAELKEEIKKSLLERKTIEAEEELKNTLIAEVSKNTKAEVPSAMIEHEIEIMLNEFKTSLAEGNLTLEAYLKGTKKEEKALREEFRKSAEIRTKGKIVLHALAEAEKIKVTPEDLEKEIKDLAEASQKSLEEFKESINEGTEKYIEDYLLRRKALNFLVGNAKIK